MRRVGRASLALVGAASAFALSGCLMMPEGVGYGDSGYDRYGSYQGDWRGDMSGSGWDRGPVEAYDAIDRADMLARRFGNAEPDFGFPFDGGYAYAWRAPTGEVMIVEPRREGSLQFFYAPGAVAPFLARDAGGSYAFDGSVATARYESSGMLRGWNQQGFDPNEASAAWERGRALLAAAQSTRWRSSPSRVPRWSYWAPVVATIFIGQDYGYGWDPYWRRRGDWQYYERYRRRPYPAQSTRPVTQQELRDGRRVSAPMWTAPADRSQAVPIHRDAPAAARSPDGGRWRDGWVESAGSQTIVPPAPRTGDAPAMRAPVERVEAPARVERPEPSYSPPPERVEAPRERSPERERVIRAPTPLDESANSREQAPE